MILKPAQYILRLDDLCPTASRQRWQRFLGLIEEFEIKPILAVVPDNRDPDLELSPPEAEFWGRVRELELAGASIGLHGYQHLSNSRGRSLVALHRATEFAGADAAAMDSYGVADSSRTRARPADLGCAASWIRRAYTERASRGGNRCAVRWVCAGSVCARWRDVDSAAALGAGGEAARALDHLRASQHGGRFFRGSAARVLARARGAVHIGGTSAGGASACAAECGRMAV